MNDEDHVHTSADEIVARLRDPVADRRAEGHYPPGLEQQLEHHFEQMLRTLHEDRTETERLRSDIEHVRQALGALGQPLAATTSRVPGGNVVHGATANLLRRHTQELTGRVGAIGDAVVDALDETVRLFDVNRAADERELNTVLAGVLDRLAVVDHLAVMVVELEDRIRALEARTER